VSVTRTDVQLETTPPGVPEPTPSPDPVPSPQPPPGTPNPGPGAEGEHPIEAEYPDVHDEAEDPEGSSD
jgi:hypothetical protein